MKRSFQSLAKEYIDETEHQGPAMSDEMLRWMESTPNPEKTREMVWREAKRFIHDFALYLKEVLADAK